MTAAFTAEVVDEKHGWDEFIDSIDTLMDEPEVLVGIRQEKGMEVPKRSNGKPGSATLAEYASANEFGTTIKHGRSGGQTVVIPERSFLRSTIDENRAEYEEKLGEELDDFILGKKSLRTALGRVGLRAVRDVKKKVRSLREPTNAPSTIARKRGKSNPLVDTGRLRNSIDLEVRVKGRGSS